ncbi:MAG: glycosyltransferase family 39 protein [Sphingobacteriaceae bacterium]|nr:glycosyltransferase family 39 protein [Sphingobacteriaceae bacterium]
MGSVVRLLAAIFSKGFGWHDDHFLIIESSSSFADGFDYNYWLPDSNDPTRVAQGHPLFYVGIHFYLFKFFNLIGLENPQFKMFIIRLLHAFWSLLVITYSYRIALQYASKKVAWYVGLFAALYWFMPFMSVRNLVEFVCVPPILLAIYYLHSTKINTKNVVLAGFWLGIAFSVRFQTVFVAGGIGLAMLIQKYKIKDIILILLSFLSVLLLTQGAVDFYIWKKPFAEFLSYVQYNLDNAGAYGTDNWHMYFDLIFGLLIPPLSILLVAGYFKTWKSMSLLFWPVFFYVTFHTYFPNKQERFIMTILPLLQIAGTVGMFQLYEKYKNKVNKGLFKFSKGFVIVVNIILLAVLTLSYSKRHRVESMLYLYHQKDAVAFMVEDSNKENDFLMPPLFYFGKWFSVLGINKNFNADSALQAYNTIPADKQPNYIVFMQGENIEKRVKEVKKRFPDLKFETTIEPSFIDKTLYYLNPLNDNQTAFIYKLK